MLSKDTEKGKHRDDEDKGNGDDKVVICLYFLKLFEPLCDRPDFTLLFFDRVEVIKLF